MSQTLWTRKRENALDDSIPTNTNTNTNANSTTSSTSTGATGALPANGTDSPFHRVTVAPNDNGKRYTMQEVFQVWYENQDSILSNPLSNQNENYKLLKPSPIYHLEIQQTPRDTESTTVPATMDKLSIDDSKPVNGSANGATNGVGLSLGPPPGIVPLVEEKPPLLSSDRIEWVYVDPSGKEQGPFNGDMMQEWLTDGYLHLDLRIRRQGEHDFQTLKDLCDKVQNYVQPFKVPLPDLTYQSQQQAHHAAVQQQQPVTAPLDSTSAIHQFLSSSGDSSLNLGAAGMRINSSMNQPNLFGINNDPFNGYQPNPGFGIDSLNFNPHGHPHQVHGQHQVQVGQSHGHGHGHGVPLPMQHHMPSILQQQIQHQSHPQPVLSRTNSGWGIDNGLMGGHNGSTPGTPVSVPSVLQSVPSVPSVLNPIQPTPMSPWLAGVPSHSRVSSPFIPTSTLDNDKVDFVLNDSQPIKIEKDELKKTDVSVAPVAPVTQTQKDAPVQEVKQVEAPSVSEKQPVKESESIEPAKVVAAASDTTSTATNNSSTSASKEEVKAHPTKITTEPVVAVPATSKPALAPWASKKVEPTKPKLTLKEIQQLEAEELKKQKQMQQQLNEQAARAAAQAWNEEQAIIAEKQQPVLPKTTGWATSASSTPVVSKKTLADIQREEAEAAAIRAAKAASLASSVSMSSSMSKTGSTGGQSSISFANAVANSTTKDDGNWTVVPKKTVVVKKLVPQSAIINNSSSKVDPNVLRSVSAVRPTVAVNEVAIREEFLVWARSSMTNLYTSVSKDDLLDIFLTLPSNSSESSLLISETIYSSSATMDGRRFAKEFLDKRARVEQQVGSSSDGWSSAIISSADKVPTVDEDGWSTGKKKKGRR